MTRQTLRAGRAAVDNVATESREARLRAARSRPSRRRGRGPARPGRPPRHRVPSCTSGRPSTRREAAPAVTNQKRSSASWWPHAVAAPPAMARTRRTSPRPSVAAAMPQSRASNPADRHGPHAASVGAVPDERLAVEGPLGTEIGRRQGEVVVDVGGMLGRARHLDHLQPGRALQHTVADAARLQHAVAGLEDERLTLVLVDDAHPTPPAVDDLEADAVVVDVVRHRSGVGDRDVRGDEPASLAAGEEVPVVHRGPSDTAGVACRRPSSARGRRPTVARPAPARSRRARRPCRSAPRPSGRGAGAARRSSTGGGPAIRRRPVPVVGTARARRGRRSAADRPA